MFYKVLPTFEVFNLGATYESPQTESRTQVLLFFFVGGGSYSESNPATYVAGFAYRLWRYLANSEQFVKICTSTCFFLTV